MYHVFVGYLLSKTKNETEDQENDRKVSKMEKLITKMMTMKKKKTSIEDGVIKLNIKTVRFFFISIK